jgi:hypothetical protein
MAWEQTLAWTLMAISVSGGGTLLSFASTTVRFSVAGKARNLVEHPSVSDYQLTALHTCVMTPAACCTMFRRAPLVSALWSGP